MYQRALREEYVADLVSPHDIDILALTKTWLGSVVDNHVTAQLVPDGCKFHTVSRPAQKRGVAIIYRLESGKCVKSQ